MRHELPVDSISAIPDGLSSNEAHLRLARFGANDVLPPSTHGVRQLISDTLRDPMVWFLLFAATLYGALGEIPETVVLVIALIPIITMDAWLHRRTQASIEGLASRLASSARVWRDKRAMILPASEIVPGDVVQVGPGEFFPADGVVVKAEAAQVDESSLSGESLPLRKKAIDGDAPPLVDHVHWVLAGTRMLAGDVTFAVACTGANTMYGGMVRVSQSASQLRTPLQHVVGKLVGRLLIIAGLLCGVLAVIRMLQGRGLVDALLSAVTLAVAALPEEFPVVLTFFLGVGVFRLARRKALVRRAVAVENIGRVTCICSDKTGTMTEGRLRLAHIYPQPGLSPDSLQLAAAMASRADSGDPLDESLYASLAAEADFTRLDVFPFSEDRRRETAIVRLATGEELAVTKGAPETVLSMSKLQENDRAQWMKKAAVLAQDGHKVIGCAQHVLNEWKGEEPCDDYEFVGLLAFEDPIREGVREAVMQAQNAGIRVIMVTGDHPSTAATIAREAGIGVGELRVIEGAQLSEHLSDHDAPLPDVVARCYPGQKLELVHALQKSGEIVAVTGDGTNDIAALQGADIGISMGERATRPAREAASIVLLDDNFRTIVDAVREGRQLFVNLRLSFAYLLIVHIPLVMTATLIPAANYPLLYLPAHIVWLELIIHPVALLAFQRQAGQRTLASMGATSNHIFGRSGWSVILALGFFLTIMIVWVYVDRAGSGDVFEPARSTAIAMLVFANVSVAAALAWPLNRFAQVTLLVAVGSVPFAMEIEQVASLLRLAALPLHDYVIALGIAVIAGFATMALRKQLK